MKIRRIVLLISLAVNALLVGILLNYYIIPQDYAPGEVGNNTREKSANSPGAGLPLKWPAYSAGDLQLARDRLRVEGFPESLVRAILADLVRAEYNKRREALAPKYDPSKWWKRTVTDAGTNKQVTALFREEQKQLEDLLGPAPRDDRAAELQWALPQLAADRISALLAIQDQYSRARGKLYSAQSYPGAPNLGEQNRILLQSEHAAMAEVLGAEDLRQYDLRLSPTAEFLHGRLSGFDPTEMEYQTIYALQSAFDADHPLPPPRDPADQRDYHQAQEELNKQIAAALGPGRYDDYQRSQDYNYRQTARLVQRLGDSPQLANELYEVQKAFQQRAELLQSAASTDADARMALPASLAALQQEAAHRVADTFQGRADAIAAYKQYGGGWITNIVPRSIGGK